ncbi:MAG: 30S ribosomal protein S1 [Candidatus Omnitrophica bacterium]|nr:30S ribosomal protein S1 [Candidatus Omnitrophota bacterium]
MSEENVTKKENTLGKEEMDSLYSKSLASIEEGQIIKGTIVAINNKDVFVDIGYKSDGIVSVNEFFDKEELKVGNVINILLEQKEDENGTVILSKEKAERSQGWDKIINNYNEGDNIEGVVSKKVKGGFMVNIGIDAFLPASLAVPREFGGPTGGLRQKMSFKIVKVNKPRKNVVLSRKDFVNEKKEQIKKDALNTIEKNSMVKGLVKNITDFGAFIDIGGGVIGLLHITDMSWGRVTNPNEVVSVGQEIDVIILDFDKESMKISLGLKQKTPNPWDGITGKYPVGSKIKGKVVNLMPYGAFVELEKGIEGLVHISELSWSKKHNHPNELLTLGQDVEAVVLEIDADGRKISLGTKQLETDPWLGIGDKYNVGDKINGKVISLTDYGAFVELEKGIDGLVHVSDISWTKKITHPKDVLKKNDEIETVILSIDQSNRRIALGIKQLENDPWDDISTKFSPGTTVKGKITKVTNFGVFVEIDKDLEGLLHVSESGIGENEKLEEKFKAGEEIEVSIIRVDGVQKKIALSINGASASAEKPSETTKDTASE